MACGFNLSRCEPGQPLRTDEVSQLRAHPHHAAAAAAADADAAARLLASDEPRQLHRAGEEDRRLLRGVRGRHPALRQARLGPAGDLRARPAGDDPRGGRPLNSLLRPAPLRSRREGGRQALRPQGAAGGAHVRPLRHAAARHGRGDDPGAQSLHHRLARRARGPALVRPFRPRRLHRPHHRLRPLDRHQHPRHRGLPALRAGARGRRAHGCHG